MHHQNNQPAENAAPRVTIISVCYNSAAILPEMLASLPPGVPVILVDNNSADGAELRRIAEAAKARLISLEANFGFGVACNHGAAGADTEFLLFLNPDARLAPTALAELTSAADKHPEAAAFGPMIEDARGRPSFKRSSVLLPRKEWPPRRTPQSDTEIPALSGAAFFVRKQAFDAVDGFDPKIFLYHEDDDLSLRLRAECGRLMLVPAARVLHHGGASSPRSAETAAMKARLLGQSRLYATRKHKRPFAYAHALASASAQLCSPLLWFSHRKRAKQIAFWRAIWAGRKQA